MLCVSMGHGYRKLLCITSLPSTAFKWLNRIESFCNPGTELSGVELHIQEILHTILVLLYIHPSSNLVIVIHSVTMLLQTLHLSASSCSWWTSAGQLQLSSLSLSLWTAPPEETGPWACCMLMLRGLEGPPQIWISAYLNLSIFLFIYCVFIIIKNV